MCVKCCHIRKELTTWPKYATEAPDQSGNTRDFHMSAVPLTEESFLQTWRTVDGRNPGVEALSTTQFFTSWRCTFSLRGYREMSQEFLQDFIRRPCQKGWVSCWIVRIICYIYLIGMSTWLAMVWKYHSWCHLLNSRYVLDCFNSTREVD